MTHNDYRYFEISKAVSKLSNIKRYKIGCCIVKKKDIVASACNIAKSSPIQKRYNVYRFPPNHEDCCHHYIHAEMYAISKCNTDLTDAKIYVYRENKNGELRMCRPCPACMEIIKERGIRDIYYTTGGGYCHHRIK